jgi:hypothetical protein
MVVVMPAVPCVMFGHGGAVFTLLRGRMRHAMGVMMVRVFFHERLYSTALPG